MLLSVITQSWAYDKSPHKLNIMVITTPSASFAPSALAGEMEEKVAKDKLKLFFMILQFFLQILNNFIFRRAKLRLTVNIE